MNGEAIKVSVLMITYNHEKYISSAIEGVLMQKTTFPIELVIGEDCSIDSTRTICEMYFRKSSNHINLLPSEANHGMIQNFIRTLEACKGEYIALCEGDDYWTDPLKLQRQVDFLESHLDYGMAYSKVKVFIEETNQYKKHCFGKSMSSIEEMLLGNYIPTSTVLFRKKIYYSYLEDIQPYQFKWLMGDYPMWLYFVSESKIKFLDNIVSVYRILGNSVSHSNDTNRDLIFQRSTLEIKLFFMKRYNILKLERKIWEHYFSMRANKVILNNGNISEFKKEISDCSVHSNINRILYILVTQSILRRIMRFYLTQKELILK
jgi:glycosyltransferase involved in cell wall biosynthesis